MSVEAARAAWREIADALAEVEIAVRLGQATGDEFMTLMEGAEEAYYDYCDALVEADELTCWPVKSTTYNPNQINDLQKPLY